MKLKLIALAGLGVFSLSLAACANNPNDPQAAASNRQVCSYHAAIGSHIGNRQCESRAAYDAQHKANHKRAQTNSDMDSGNGGGR